MVEMMAEAAVWIAVGNMRDAMDEEVNVPIWRRILLSMTIIVVVLGLVGAHLKGMI